MPDIERPDAGRPGGTSGSPRWTRCASPTASSTRWPMAVRSPPGPCRRRVGGSAGRLARRDALAAGDRADRRKPMRSPPSTPAWPKSGPAGPRSARRRHPATRLPARIERRGCGRRRGAVHRRIRRGGGRGRAGDALYGVRTMLFGASKQVRDDQVGLAAKTELNQVQSLIAQGDWEQAQDRLVAVSTQVATIDDEQQKQELLDQFNDLSAKVVERDPQATAPRVWSIRSAGVVGCAGPGRRADQHARRPPLTTSTTTVTTAPTASPVIADRRRPPRPPASPSGPASPSSTAPSAAADPQSQQTTTPTSAAPTSAAPTMESATPTTTAAPPGGGSGSDGHAGRSTAGGRHHRRPGASSPGE